MGLRGVGTNTGQGLMGLSGMSALLVCWQAQHVDVAGALRLASGGGCMRKSGGMARLRVDVV